MTCRAGGLCLAGLAGLAVAAGAAAGQARAQQAPAPPVPPSAATPSEPTPPPAPATAAPDETARVSEVTVVGTREKQTAGSAHIVKSRDLERFDHDDAHQVLKQVPGVYARGEDGVGLRPNIGIRGVSPDRSKKVTLMEDGVLFGPAPYSAPAAYYFPLITRMESVRVIKGPGAVSFGPQTVGGAIDLVTRRVPTTLAAGADLGGGQYGYGKAHVHAGGSGRRFGGLIEGVHLRSSGFKELDGGGDTGFQRNELMGKARFVPAPGAAIYNELELKLGYSTEGSNETYLGLSDEDLRATPQRRYLASALDRMEWRRTSLALRHVIDGGAGRSLESVVYRNDFARTWRKVNRFHGLQEDVDQSPIAEILRDPHAGRNQLFYDVLTGATDTPSPEYELFIGPNQRTFVSEGLQTRGNWRLDGAAVSQRLEAGARVHHDRIDRLHSEDPYAVSAGALERADGPTRITADGRAQALALAVHALDAVTWRRLTLTPGLRFELIHTSALDRRTGEEAAGAPQRVLIPGAGAYFAATPLLGLFAGAYRGFSPAAPGQPASVEPETSWNYEAGVRASGARGRAEVVGFFNDYQNLTSQCTMASGCRPDQLDTQFNAGRAHVFGAEVFGQTDLRVGGGFVVPVTLSYTFTRTRLLESFTSDDPQLGTVEAGDELPYVPRHQGLLTAALEHARFGLQLGVSFVSAAREEAGQDAPPPGLSTDESLVLEAGGRYYVVPQVHVYLHVRNMTNAADIASHRPFGARPISPRWIVAGVKGIY